MVVAAAAVKLHPNPTSLVEKFEQTIIPKSNNPCEIAAGSRAPIHEIDVLALLAVHTAQNTCIGNEVRTLSDATLAAAVPLNEDTATTLSVYASPKPTPAMTTTGFKVLLCVLYLKTCQAPMPILKVSSHKPATSNEDNSANAAAPTGSCVDASRNNLVENEKG
jgi:hypothetical protein